MKYKHFGVMLDCSRNAVPKVSTVKKLIDVLQIMGYNTLELYTEDTFEITEEPYFGYLRGRYTGAEIREMDEYAKAQGIELIPCVQTLAHFTNPVKLPRFAEITDIDDILLIDDEKTYAFIERIFATLAENFTSRNVHIGMDEAHHVGLGKYLDKHGASNRFEILNRHLGRVISIAEKYGFAAHMWSDMFFRLAAEGDYYGHDVQLPAEVMKNLPSNISLAYWDYYHTEESHYDAMISLHKKFNRDIWFAGGAWTWSGFAPQTRFTYATMQPALKSVRKNKIENVLITLWGDNGGECPPFTVLNALYAIRRYADGEYDHGVIAAEFQKLFGVAFEDFDLLALPDIPATSHAPDALINPCKALLYSDPFLGIYDGTTIVRQAEIPYSEYAKKLSKAKLRAGEYTYLFDTSEKLCKLLEKKAYLGVQTREAYQCGDRGAIERVIGEYAEAEKRLESFFQAFDTQWNTVNKPFGFEVHCARLGGLQRRLLYCRRRLEGYLAGTIQRIDELEEKLLPRDPNAPDMLFLNDYRQLVSTSEL